RAVQPVMRLEGLVAGELATRRREADVQALAALAPAEPTAADDPARSAGAQDREAARPSGAVAPAETSATHLRLDGIDVRPELAGMTRLEAAFASDEAPGAPLIEGASLDLRRGAMAAISGASGTGKTALLSVVAGRLAPAAGTVAFFDAAGAPAAPRIAFLPQAPALLEGTALDNMTRFRPDLHLEEAMSLATALGIDEFFARHPQGLSLPIRRGVETGMPASVAQGVGLIGGLVGDPDVILFDEANLSLDGPTDARLLQVILSRRSRSIVVMTTQRPSWRRVCDLALTLDGGRLAKVPGHRPPLRLAPPLARRLRAGDARAAAARSGRAA
ncbi:MAG: ATP-binding cassette domain-containing protein, partial [Pseudomonadota bacterium]